MAGLRADPNPVPFERGPGTTIVTWQTGSGEIGEVFLVEDTAERLFARGAHGSQEAAWLGQGPTKFRLYSQDNANVLAELVVQRGEP